MEAVVAISRALALKVYWNKVCNLLGRFFVGLLIFILSNEVAEG